MMPSLTSLIIMFLCRKTRLKLQLPFCTHKYKWKFFGKVHLNVQYPPTHPTLNQLENFVNFRGWTGYFCLSFSHLNSFSMDTQACMSIVRWNIKIESIFFHVFELHIYEARGNGSPLSLSCVCWNVHFIHFHILCSFLHNTDALSQLSPHIFSYTCSHSNSTSLFYIAKMHFRKIILCCI